MATILESSRLIFRHHQLSDLEAYCAMESNPESRTYVGGSPRTREAAEERFMRIYLPEPEGKLALWAAELKEDGCYVGYCGIYPHFNVIGEPIPMEGTLAFYIAPEFWGMGLATETGRSFLRFGFEELGLQRVVATVQEGNIPSLRVMEKLKMNRLPELVPIGVKQYHFFELTADAYAQLPGM
jgi:[ribosomal protein S5]-alanine N-acetyltransferase